jgi:hypothetical protein
VPYPFHLLGGGCGHALLDQQRAALEEHPRRQRHLQIPAVIEPALGSKPEGMLVTT